MPRINYEALVSDYQLLESEKPSKGTRWLKESFQAKDLRPHDFDLGRLFEAIFGWQEFRACRSDRSRSVCGVMEAAGAVSTNSFQNISGQIVFNSVMEQFTSEDFTFTSMIPTKGTDLSGEKIPGITTLGDEATVVKENDPYPLAGVGEDYIETPETLVRGLIVPVSKRAIFFDRTGILLDRCGKLAYALGLNKEKRAIDCVIDENGGAAASPGHRYKWRGSTIATYGNNSGTHSWDNLEASNTLLDHTSIDKLEQLFAGLRDPNTNEPITVKADTLIVTPQLVGLGWRILNSMMVSMQAGGFATSGNLYRTDALSPLGKTEFSPPYKLVSTRLLQDRLGIDTSWFLGAPSKAFAWMENWPMTPEQAAPNSHDEFHRDIVTQFKISEMGAYATIEPRFMSKATVA